MNNDAVVVGGGIAGLTAAAYLSRAGYSTLLLEKESNCGGLVNSFTRNGFVYDGGIRAMENSGMLFPMLKQLGLDVEFVKNKITVGIKDHVIRIQSEDNIHDYQNLLNTYYPESVDEISEIIQQIKKIMDYMEVQYSIDNPSFLDLQKDREYMIKEIIPWIFKYLFTYRKIASLNDPVVDFLKQYTNNQALLDNITQHFFKETPAFFALSYLKIYLEYNYPLGGTGKLVEEMVSFIKKHEGQIRNNSRITSILPDQHLILDSNGNEYHYRQMVWAADQKTLYELIDLDHLSDTGEKRALMKRRSAVADKVGNDSVFTVYLAVDLDPDFFSQIASEHFFYTPQTDGESAAGEIPIGENRVAIEIWLKKFFAFTTYEMSIPVLRDSSLAPPGKTGLIVSVLFDYRLTKYIQEAGWYQDFKLLCEELTIDVLEGSIFPGLKTAVIDRFSSTPLTMERYTANTDGAITGWSFTNNPLPAENRLTRIFRATKTPIMDIAQAGQWTYSPSGFPISILTGKLAADRVIKELKRKS